MRKNYILFIAISLFCGLNQMHSQTGKSLHFDGANDEINCGNDASVQITGSNITLEALVKLDSFRTNVWQGNIINMEECCPDAGYMLRAGGNGVVNFNIGNGGWNELNSPANTLTIGTWYHLAATYDGTDMKIYVDGVEVASQNMPGINITTSSANLFIGNWAQTGDRHINGAIDEVRVWNIARTSSDIATNMDNTLTLPQTGLVAYYKFNQGIAAGNNTTETTANDELGVNNGALTNFTLTGATSNWIGDTSLTVSEFSYNNNIVVYPNPASHFIQISNLNETKHYRIFNIIGSIISDGTIDNNQKIEVQNLKNGIYFLSFDDGNTIKFIKN